MARRRHRNPGVAPAAIGAVALVLTTLITTYFSIVRDDEPDPPPTTHSTGSTISTISTGGPQVVPLRPIADSYANQSDRAANYGRSHSLLSRGTPGCIVYLRFAFPAVPPGKTLTNAVLQIRTTRMEYAGSEERHAVSIADNSWAEESINWNNRPSLGVVVGDFLAQDVDTEYRFELDVSKLQAPQGSQLTLAITSLRAQGTDNLQFWSRDHEAVDIRPLLTLTFT